MSRVLRRVRGAIGLGLAWAFAWFGAGMVLLLIVGPDAADVPFPLGFGMFGFLAGATFSAVLGAVDGRRSFDQMSIPRFAGWGAVGGFVLAGLFSLALEGGAILVVGPVFALASAASAAGSLALARMAEDGDLLDAGGDRAGARRIRSRETSRGR